VVIEVINMLSVTKLGFGLVVLALFATIANAQVKPPPVVQEWVARYNGLGNGLDGSSTLTVDREGSVFVTGKSSGTNNYADIVTLKYGPDGNPVWAQRYDGFGNGFGWNFPSALAVDSGGNALVVGKSTGAGGYDIVTLKYGPDGNPVWAQRYDGLANGNDEAYALVVNKNRTVFVAGRSLNSKGNYDLITLKYHPDGKLLWARHYDNGLDDEARAIAVDSKLNIYVTGRSLGDTGYDIVTLKYEPKGNLLWAQRYNGPGDGNDQARAIAVDSLSNVYVTGKSWDGSSMGYATLKFDPDGNLLWTQFYNGPGDGDDSAVALALYEEVKVNMEVEVSVYVTGKSMDANGADSSFATLKYSGSDGTLLWEKRYNGPRKESYGATALAVDSKGNVYVTGTVIQGFSATADYATLKYDPDGNLLWTQFYNGPANQQDSATALALDGQGNVYVTGGSADSDFAYSDIATVQYKQN
jgi:hypothetical protein